MTSEDTFTPADLAAVNALPAAKRGPIVALTRQLIAAAGKPRTPRQRIKTLPFPWLHLRSDR